MSEHRMTRRAALKAGAAITPLAVTASAMTKPAAKSGAVTIGMATLQFRKHTNAELAKELAAAGIRVVQLFLSQKDSNYWKFNGRNDVSDMTAARCKDIAGAYRSQGIAIHSIGVYTNLIHPDPAERKANLAYFEDMMTLGGHMGVQTFITEAGHYHDPDKPAPKVEHHFREDVWKTTVATGKELGKIADRHNATVLVEPFFRSFFASAKRTRVFLEEVGSPRIRALLDPANLLELNDLEEMFNQLGPHIGCLHAKDRKLHVDRGVAAGQGDIDYPKFVTLAAQRTPDAPLILEYVGATNYKQALTHLRSILRKVSINEK